MTAEAIPRSAEHLPQFAPALPLDPFEEAVRAAGGDPDRLFLATVAAREAETPEERTFIAGLLRSGRVGAAYATGAVLRAVSGARDRAAVLRLAKEGHLDDAVAYARLRARTTRTLMDRVPGAREALAPG